MNRRLQWAVLLACIALPAFGLTTLERSRDLPHLDGVVAIDGVLDEAVWHEALIVDRFYEYTPGDNTPPVVQTEGYLWYDTAALYVAFYSHDPHPEQIRAVLSDRDTVFTDQDVVQFDLDTHNEEKSSFIFRVNPRGVRADGIFSEAAGADDFSPDVAFDVAARIVEDGWIAEFRIPFSSLRYSSEPHQTWGITLFRNYPRDYRRQMTSLPIPRGANCWLCYNLKLEGVSQLPPSHDLLFVPYTSAQRTTAPSGAREAMRAGADFKWIPNNQITLDATIRPDYAQLEADDPQISVNSRFALFIPEKRSFFLERADLLTTPLGAIYTRTVTSPVWGVRLTGQAGDSAYTFLVAQDEGGGSRNVPGPLFSRLEAQTNDNMVAIARWRRSIGNAYAGLVFTALDTPQGSNLLFGPDLLWRAGEAHQVEGQFLVSRTRGDLIEPGGDATDSALSLAYEYSTASFGAGLSVTRLGRDFRAENGFIPQVGVERTSGHVALRFYPEGWFNAVETGVEVDATREIGHELVSRAMYPYVTLDGRWKTSLRLELHNQEQVRTDEQLLQRSFVRYELAIHPSEKLASVAIGGELGEQTDVVNDRVGRGGTVSLKAKLRPTAHITTEADAERQWIKIDADDVLKADVAQLKSTYFFTPRTYLRLIGRYEYVLRNPRVYREPVPRGEGSTAVSLLYGFRFNWLTSFYLGYSKERLLDREHAGEVTRSLFMKLAYAID